MSLFHPRPHHGLDFGSFAYWLTFTLWHCLCRPHNSVACSRSQPFNLFNNFFNEDEVSDSDFDLSDSESSAIVKKKRKKVTKAMQQGADTAEQFFRVVFNAHCDAAKETELQEWLSEPLENGRFVEHCTKAASEHLAQIETEEAGSVEYTDVNDKDLQKLRDHATSMWSLVKTVTISTGSVLLRNGIRFMDLPRYGDLNQTRSAVVNEYRNKADFELIVAKSDRYLTKTDEDRFLQRAIRQHRPKNVFLVLNKVDSCLETPQHQIVRMLEDEDEEPFSSIYKHLFNLKSLKDEDRRLVQQYRRYLIREAQMADGQRECDKIRAKVERKGVQVFPVSSARYFDWLDPTLLEGPPYDPEGTGIPLLRRSLLKVPAEANHKGLCDHVFETLVDIEDKVSRILMKFSNDVDVNAIRRYLLEHLPGLSSDLRNLSITVPGALVPEAWSDATKRKNASGLEKYLIRYPADEVHYQTFWLMLRNNGIATCGKFPGKNLNNEFLGTYKNTIKSWKNKVMPKARELYAQLDEPVQATIKELKRQLREASSDPILKQKVGETLEKFARRIQTVRGTLLNQLHASTNENYLYFTTEDDTKCPVAQELKSAYARINVMRMDERPKHRRGIYKQQRAELIKTVTKANLDRAALVDAISVRVKTRQCEN